MLSIRFNWQVLTAAVCWHDLKLNLDFSSEWGGGGLVEHTHSRVYTTGTRVQGVQAKLHTS